ncbi:MAG: aldehyde dehydrogenase (NADP(+)) [Kineosporiaceae bacterium]|nr:aldehyde dehydrogenase (NADP(+)) [Kineosporiaceae bacterium]
MSAPRFLTVETACAAAAEAAPWMAASTPADRAVLLEALADAIDAASADLVPIAGQESRLPEARLIGEVARTSGQLRLFAEVVREGSFLEVTVDHPRADLTPPRPDLRRCLAPLGPVAVFTASNFPFAFSTLGNDTASALAAGCPVVVKTHPGHPRLTEAVMAVADKALSAVGAPAGVLTAVGPALEVGVELIEDRRIGAVGFTGSARGGFALQQIAQNRAVPIPFYGELGSINPVFVTAAAAAERAGSIAAEYVASFTLGSGQFCTKPGLFVAPRSEGLRTALRSAVAAVTPAEMLNDTIRGAFVAGLGRLQEIDGVEVVHPGGVLDDAAVAPTLLAVPVSRLLEAEQLLEECFGPVSLVVEYEDEAALVDVARTVPGVLTATVIAQGGEPVLAPLIEVIRQRAGRVIWNGWPTGVAVTWAQHHGGPFPSTTNALHTSVGASAVRRFLRPVVWQGWPDELLPAAVQESNPWALPRRVDGVLETAST